MKLKKRYLCLCLFCSQPAWAADDSIWYLKPTVGISQMSDQKANTIAVGTIDGIAEINLDSGFTPGLAVGYNYGNGWAAEMGWEYRSNDSETTTADGTFYADGNYASSVFFLNGYYHFKNEGQWQPYIGAGLMIGQEIDIDLESNGVEQSFTGDGETGFQVMAGVSYLINDSWRLNGEVRYGSFTGVDLEGEGNDGLINGLDYEPLTLGLGLQYNF